MPIAGPGANHAIKQAVEKIANLAKARRWIIGTRSKSSADVFNAKAVLPPGCRPMLWRCSLISPVGAFRSLPAIARASPLRRW